MNTTCYAGGAKRQSFACVDNNIIHYWYIHDELKSWIECNRWNGDGWYYYSNGIKQKGWQLIDGNWYFCYAHGQMAHDTTIDGYYLNSDGAWTNSEITADEARKLILQVDSTYIVSKPNYQVSTNYREYSEENNLYFGTWNFPKEPMYEFFFDNENDGLGSYLVGKESKSVYALYNQGNANAYQIEGNSIKKTFIWMGVGKNYDWR